MKAVTVRLDDAEAERLEQLKAQLKNSDAGVVRFALELLYNTSAEKGVIPLKPEPECAGA